MDYFSSNFFRCRVSSAEKLVSCFLPCQLKFPHYVHNRLFSMKCDNHSAPFKDAKDVSLDVACSLVDSLSILMTDTPLENLGV